MIFGCSNQIESKALVGKYVANHKKALDTIELNADGLYIYHYKAGSIEIKNSNKWSFEYVDGKPTMSLRILFLGFRDMVQKSLDFGLWKLKDPLVEP